MTRVEEALTHLPELLHEEQRRAEERRAARQARRARAQRRITASEGRFFAWLRSAPRRRGEQTIDVCHAAVLVGIPASTLLRITHGAPFRYDFGPRPAASSYALTAIAPIDRDFRPWVAKCQAKPGGSWTRYHVRKLVEWARARATARKAVA